jgi:hypothetical protein
MLLLLMMLMKDFLSGKPWPTPSVNTPTLWEMAYALLLEAVWQRVRIV